jgi:hypothetical protein
MYHELWDGHGVESLAPFLSGEASSQDVPHGLMRLLVHETLRGIWLSLDGGESERETREALPEWLGVSEDATEDEIRDALVAEAAQGGLTEREMRGLRQFLGYPKIVASEC